MRIDSKRLVSFEEKMKKLNISLKIKICYFQKTRLYIMLYTTSNANVIYKPKRLFRNTGKQIVL